MNLNFFKLIFILNCVIIKIKGNENLNNHDHLINNDKLNRLKGVFLRNGMNIFSNHENEEYEKPRNTRILFPEDELMLNYEKNNATILDPNLTVIQGDIIEDKNLPTRKKRRIITNNQYGNPTRWPNGIIPFDFDFDATDFLKEKFNTAIKIWHENTCIRFEPYSPLKHPFHKSKVLIRNRGHCAARVGYTIDPNRKLGISDIYLPEHCPLGSVLHELGHVIGFRHEHTRYDRNEHINVHYEKMQTAQRPQYDVMENGFPGYFGIYYDLYSIMHYSSQNGLIESKDEKRSFLMGQRFTLSFSDIKMANQAYNCNQNCSNKDLKCLNEGFVDSNCKCRCPEHLTGEYCERIVTKYPSLKNSTNPKLTCNFETDLCDWIQEQTRDSEEWIRNIGYTKTQINFKKEKTQLKTGPQLIEQDRVNSTYVYLNSYDQTKAYANSILTSPQILVNQTENHCIKFFYHMYSYPLFKPDSPEIGKLSLKLRYSNGEVKKIWDRFGNQGEEWQKTCVEFKLEPPHTVIFFEAEVVDWKYGDIALDDIEYIKGSCEVNNNVQPITTTTTTTSTSKTTTMSTVTVVNWSTWSEWSNCSKPCDKGFKRRERVCLTNNCLGNSIEYIDCNNEPCPTKTTTEEWGPWSKCSVSCGNGFQTRYKNCLSNYCNNSSKEIRPCSMEGCIQTTTANFFIAKWSLWSEWSECNSTCDSTTTQFSQRVRECQLPKNEDTNKLSYIKNECIGPNKEIKQCEKKKCVIDRTEWSEWSDCSSKCGQGTKTRVRQCSKSKFDFPCENSELIMERTICSSNENCEVIKIAWSEWSEWSNCSSNCGQGYSYRIRDCLNWNKTCEGLSKEIKMCTDKSGCLNPTTHIQTTTSVIEIIPPKWSEWSEWSNCISKVKCGIGFKIRKRLCLLDKKIINNSYCDGSSVNTSECLDENCNLDFNWSVWSNCSTKCGTGLITRAKECSTKESCFGHKIYDQKTCENFQDCEREPNYMECSFDKPGEYCPLEQVDKGNSIWEIDLSTLFNYSKFKIKPSPDSGGKFVTLSGRNKRSSIQTPIVSNEKVIEGQCLSFNFFLIGDSRIEVNKVNLDGTVQLLFVQDSLSLRSIKWQKALLSVQSQNDYFIEFTALNGNNFDSMVALDDIELNPIEKCLVLSCSFGDDQCKPNNVLNQTVSSKLWISQSFIGTNSSYLRADLYHLRDDQTSFYGFPIVIPSYSSMCLSFMYLMSGSGSTELRVGVVQGSSLSNYIWKETTLNNKVWKKSMIDFTVENSFQIALELIKLENKESLSNEFNRSIELIALDNLKISYGSCNILTDNFEYEENNLIESMSKMKRDFTDFQPNLIEKCGGVFQIGVNETLTVQNEGYPNSYKLNQYCSFLIKTNVNNKLKVSILDMDLEDNERHDQCIDFLEIRYFNLGQPGPKYCGKFEKYDGEFTIDSYKNSVMLIFSSDWAITKTGFKLRIKSF